MKAVILGVASSYRSFSGSSFVDNLYNSIDADVVLLSDEKVFCKYHVPYKRFNEVNSKEYDLVILPSTAITKEEERKINKFNTDGMLVAVSSFDNRGGPINDDMLDSFSFKDGSIFLFPTKALCDAYKAKYSLKKAYAITFPYASEYKVGRKNNRCFITTGLVSELVKMDCLMEVLGEINCRFEMIFGLGSYNKGVEIAKNLFDKIVSNGNVLMSYCRYGYNKTFLVSEITKSAAYVDLYSNTNLYGLRYTELEAVDLGCIPIVPMESKEQYDKLNIKALYYSDVKTLSESMKIIINGLADSGLMDNNRESLRNIKALFSEDMEKIFKNHFDYSFKSISKNVQVIK